MKLAKKMLMGSMLLVPTLAMGIAQQDPQQPAAGQQLQQNQQLRQDQATQPGAAHKMTGEIVEVRDDSFSLRAEDHTMWFTFTPANKSAWTAELVTGNRVTVTGTPGDAPDRMVATSIVRAETADTYRERDTDTQIAQNELRTDDDAFDNDDDAFDTDDDRDELPRTASSLPAIGSLGLLALLGAAAVAVARRF